MGGCGGTRGRLKNGREARKPATKRGLSHRSRTTRFVGWAGQEKRWFVVCGAVLQEGHRLLCALPTLSRKLLRDEQYPERS